MFRVLPVIAALLVFAAGARATDDAAGCSSATDPAGLCDARRPMPEITMQPANPHVGSPVVLSVSSPGRGLTYAWTLGDGRSQAGASVTTTFSRDATVAVVATDEDGRTGSQSRTVIVHAANVAPTGTLRLLTPSPGPGTLPSAVVDASDPDGQVTRIDLDVMGEGDGVFQEFAPGETDELSSEIRDVPYGTYTARAKVTDDSGAVTVLTTQYVVHPDNIAPVVSLTASASAVGQPVTLTASATDPDESGVALEFDLDGDGTYETPSPDGTAQTTFASAGPHVVGVRAPDGDVTTTVRQTIDVGGGGPAIILPAGPVRPAVPVTLSADRPGTWDANGDGVADGTGSSISFTYPSPGDYFVHFGDEWRTVHVVADTHAPAVTALNVPDVVVAGEPATVSASAVDPDGGPVTLAYDLDGDGQFDDSPVGWTFTAPVRIAVKATDPAGHSAVRTADVTPAAAALGPDAGLIVPDDIVAGQPVQLAASGGTAEWDTDGDGSFDDSSTATFAAGTHTVAVRIGGALTLEQTFTVGGTPPVADFTAATDGALTSTATGATSLSWDLDGDGRFGDATGPTAEADVSSAHLVGLRALNAGGDAAIRYRRVGEAATPTPTPTATATATPTATATATATASATPTATQTPAPTATAAPPAPTAVPLPAPSPAPSATPRPDRTPPRLSARPRAATRAGLAGRGLQVVTRCSEACTVAMDLTATRSAATRLHLRDLGRVTRTLRAGRSTTLTVKLASRARAGARHTSGKLSLQLRVTATDPAGNRSVVTRSLVVSR